VVAPVATAEAALPVSRVEAGPLVSADESRAELERQAAERQAAERKAAERLVWRYRPSVTAPATPHPLRGCPAVDAQGRVFVAFGSSLVMLVLADGKPTPHWIYATGGPILRSPVIGPDGIIRVHSTDGYLHLVSPDGARVGVPAAVGPPLGWATPLVDKQNRTWIARTDGGLVSVEPGGQVASRLFYRTRRRFDCTGVILGDVLYIGCEDHFVHAVPLTAERGENSWNAASGAGRTGCAISCPLAVTRGPELLVVSQDDQLHAFRIDGSASWAVPLPGQVLGSPVVDRDGTILLGISQTPRNQPARGVLLGIDAATRRARWQFATDAPVESTPVIGDDGHVYFGDNGGAIYALDRHGGLAWRAQLDAPVRSAGTFPAPNLVAFGLDDGSLVAVRCSSQGLASDGWPKFQGTLHQSGLNSSPA
jgi:outer membrane protein assembly factor BamB